MKPKKLLNALSVALLAGILFCLPGSWGIAQQGVQPIAEQGPLEIIDNTYIPPQGEALFMPGEMVAVFKEGADPEKVLNGAGIAFESIERSHPIEPVVKKYRGSLKEEGLEKDSEGWFWFRGKEYKEVGEVEDGALFEEAYKDMRPTRQALYRKYKIILADGVSVDEAVAILRKLPEVEEVYPVGIPSVSYIPNDSYFNHQWALLNTEQTIDILGKNDPGTNDVDLDACEPDSVIASDAWDIEDGNPGIVIAIIDTGVDYNHIDLASNIWRDGNNNPGRDFVDINTSVVLHK